MAPTRPSSPVDSPDGSPLTQLSVEALGVACDPSPMRKTISKGSGLASISQRNSKLLSSSSQEKRRLNHATTATSTTTTTTTAAAVSTTSDKQQQHYRQYHHSPQNQQPHILSVSESMMIECPMMSNNQTESYGVSQYASQSGHHQRQQNNHHYHQHQQQQHYQQHHRATSSSNLFLYTKFNALYRYLISVPNDMSACDELRSYQFWKCVRTEFLTAFLFVTLTTQLLITTTYNNHKSSHTNTLSQIDSSGDDNILNSDISASNNDNNHSHQSSLLLLLVALLNGLFQAFTVASLTQIFGNISGCHIVPSISLALLVRRHITLTRFTCYLIAQLFGSVIAVSLLWSLSASIVEMPIVEQVSSVSSLVAPYTGVTSLAPVSYQTANSQQPEFPLRAMQMLLGDNVNNVTSSTTMQASMQDKFNHDFSHQIRFLRAKRSEGEGNESLPMTEYTNELLIVRDTNKQQQQQQLSEQAIQVTTTTPVATTTTSTTTTTTTVAPPITTTSAANEPTTGGNKLLGDGSELILLSILDELHNRKKRRKQEIEEEREAEGNKISGTRQPKRQQQQPATHYGQWSAKSPYTSTETGTGEMVASNNDHYIGTSGHSGHLHTRYNNNNNNNGNNNNGGKHRGAAKIMRPYALAGRQVSLAQWQLDGGDSSSRENLYKTDGTDREDDAKYESHVTNDATSGTVDVRGSNQTASVVDPTQYEDPDNKVGLTSSDLTVDHLEEKRRRRKRRYIGATPEGRQAHLVGANGGSQLPSNLLEMPSTSTLALASASTVAAPLTLGATNSQLEASKRDVIISMIDYALPPPAAFKFVAHNRKKKLAAVGISNVSNAASVSLDTNDVSTNSRAHLSVPVTNINNINDNRRDATTNKPSHTTPIDITDTDLFNTSQLFGFQFIATLLIVLTYLANVEPSRQDLGFKALSIGLAYFVGYTFTSLSGGLYAHPFQLMSLALFAQRWNNRWFIYLITPFVAGLFAAFTYEYLEFSSTKNRQKSHNLRRSFHNDIDEVDVVDDHPVTNNHLVSGNKRTATSDNDRQLQLELQLEQQQQRQIRSPLRHATGTLLPTLNGQAIGASDNCHNKTTNMNDLLAANGKKMKQTNGHYKQQANNNKKLNGRNHLRAASSVSSLESGSDAATRTDIELSPLSSPTHIAANKCSDNSKSNSYQVEEVTADNTNTNNHHYNGGGVSSSSTTNHNNGRKMSKTNTNHPCPIKKVGAAGAGARLCNLRQSNFDENFIISEQQPQQTTSNNNQPLQSPKGPFLGQTTTNAAINY